MSTQEQHEMEQHEMMAADGERLTGYHDPESIEPEMPASVESRYGFQIVVRGHASNVASFDQFAVRVVDAYAGDETADVAVRIVTDEAGTTREFTEDERLRLLDFAVGLVLA